MTTGVKINALTDVIITQTPGFGEVIDTGWQLKFFTKNAMKSLLSASRVEWFEDEETARREEKKRNRGLKGGRWIAVHTGERV
ncbi:hypothetical protein SEA_FORZA_26 [Gordonia phage Forza]|uniref:Uncharacterized protein n=1 Tax=Gordonia phage Forza TaxID=2571247 RepID=A0A650EYW5_9CAUD|nr:hypothetical protein PP303_gp026 [Gordonia phage Forza]QEM41495.1 hypothetical protein SEA_BOOPY_26 [Gordonia phage Boopy]QGT55019.1 hypothetical protein SEA_FORZA_26 [Gordonia phage Forza]UXE04168.1 hypothetical protein SEA_BLUENGOLD_24 [Gordonia phage BlueNGold]WBF03807.1 hypothetical protein SEA_MAREELIH_24 [Gordonia phage Mareelih]